MKILDLKNSNSQIYHSFLVECLHQKKSIDFSIDTVKNLINWGKSFQGVNFWSSVDNNFANNIPHLTRGAYNGFLDRKRMSNLMFVDGNGDVESLNSIFKKYIYFYLGYKEPETASLLYTTTLLEKILEHAGLTVEMYDLLVQGDINEFIDTVNIALLHDYCILEERVYEKTEKHTIKKSIPELPEVDDPITTSLKKK